MQDTLKANPCIYTALAKHFTNIGWGHAPFPGELLVHDCPLSGDLFLLSNLSVLRYSFKPFPVSCHQRRAALPLLLPPWEDVVSNEVPPSVSSRNWTNLTSSAVPQKSCPLIFSPSLFLPLDIFWSFYILLTLWGPKLDTALEGGHTIQVR